MASGPVSQTTFLAFLHDSKILTKLYLDQLKSAFTSLRRWKTQGETTTERFPSGSKRLPAGTASTTPGLASDLPLLPGVGVSRTPLGRLPRRPGTPSRGCWSRARGHRPPPGSLVLVGSRGRLSPGVFPARFP